jgi:hypothetical protein
MVSRAAAVKHSRFVLARQFIVLPNGQRCSFWEIAAILRATFQGVARLLKALSRKSLNQWKTTVQEEWLVHICAITLN